ncbi:hypothetical protein BTS2_3302 [Bacillus sp. TS-2]|nr:hypothetical protein BTS2_3302 [Bacillus sp. TS-2]
MKGFFRKIFLIYILPIIGIVVIIIVAPWLYTNLVGVFVDTNDIEVVDNTEIMHQIVIDYFNANEKDIDIKPRFFHANEYWVTYDGQRYKMAYNFDLAEIEKMVKWHE